MRFFERAIRGVGLLALVASVALVGCSSGSSSSSGSGGGSTGAGSTASGSSTQVTAMSTPRSEHTASLSRTGDALVVAGGKHADASGQLGVSDTVEVLDPATGAWSMASDRLASPRMNHVAATLGNGLVMIAGGQSDLAGNQALNTIDLYNPQTDQFTRSSATLSAARSDATAIAFQANGINYVLIAGGRDASGQALRSADLYNADADTVTPVNGQMAMAFADGDAVELSNGQIFLQGGVDANGQPVGYQIFDPQTLSFGHAGNLRQDRADSALARAGSEVVVAGGHDGNGADLASAEAWNPGQTQPPATNASLRVPRSGMTATEVGNGIVFIGGQGSGALVLEVEVYENGQFSSGATLNVGRLNHTSTDLGNGHVAVVGGEDQQGQPTASVEVLAPSGANVPGGPGSKQPTGPAPQIASLSPTSGPVGTSVTIDGSNFAQQKTDNVVRLNGIGLPVQSVNTASGQHQLTVTIPGNATTGDITVEVNGQVSNGEQFTVGSGGSGGGSGSGGATGPITIWLVLPQNVSSFMPVSITGSGFTRQAIPYFGNTPSLSLVSFNISNIPLVGSVAEMVTITPMNAQPGPQTIHLEDNGFVSNQMSITVQ